MKTCTVILLLAVVALPCNAWWFSDPRVEPHEDVSDECLRLAEWGRCEFYECLERRFPCGHRGYAVHVGLHFCRTIINMMDEFTTEGYQWMNRTSVCLTKSLLPVYESYATRCDDLRDDGADGIVECNARTDPDGQDFCSFVQDNAEAYQNIFGLEEIQRMIRLRKPLVIARLLIDGASCGAEPLQDRLYAVSGMFNDLIGSLQDHFEGLTDRWNNLWN
ncbi:uncharacterized protein LOC123556807 [Mercenaria mercenaria]|uniref:uncharacterized protein LOC123556807 n=1 Tax=Mercenaria mercenaria TaxID=6596 RepID=UPI00234EBCD9|nr:uncharacterized protein LOC123556807 [Mercenaria mercenaria]